MDGLLSDALMEQYAAQRRGLLEPQLPSVAPSPNFSDQGSGTDPSSFADRFGFGLPVGAKGDKLANPQDVRPSAFADRWDAAPLPPPLELGSAANTSGERPPMSFAPQDSKSPAVVPETSFLGRIGNFLGNNSSMLMALGAGLAGAPSLGTGISRGLAAAIPARRQDIAQQNQNATIMALMHRVPGLSLADANAIANNPTLMAQIAPKMFGAKEYSIERIKGISGAEKLIAVNKVDPTDTFPVGGAKGAGGGAEDISDEHWAAMTPDQRLMTVDPEVRDMLRSLHEGNIKNPARLPGLLPLATRIWPDLNEQDFKTKMDTRTAFDPKGDKGKELTAYNTMVRHVDDANALLEQIDPKGWTNFIPAVTSPIRNMYYGQTDPAYQKLSSRLNELLDGVATEKAKAIHGGRPNDSDVKEARAELNAKIGSKAGLQGALEEAVHMVNRRMEENQATYRRGMLDSARTVQEFMSPRAAELYRKYTGEEAAPAALHGATGEPVTSPAAVAPAPSHRAASEIRTDPKTGKRYTRGPNGEAVEVK